MSPVAAAPPTVPRDAEETALLLRFVHERDVRCPRCDYNLRNLTQPVCPECREDLQLSVGARRPSLGWLIVALAPAIFSGIAAVFVIGEMVLVALTPGGVIPRGAYILDSFGWLSAVVGVLIYLRRYKFLKQRLETQIAIAAVLWFVHVAFFFVMWVLMG